MKKGGSIFKFLPNVLTISRMVPLTLSVVFFLVQGERVTACALFIVAAAMDSLDGWFARRFDCKTPFGEMMDPIADKVLVVSTLIPLTFHGLTPWIIWPIAIRELVVTIIRYSPNGSEVKVNGFGKSKAVCQYIGISYAILHLPGFNWVMALVAAITVASGLQYLFKYLEVCRAEVGQKQSC